MRLHILPHLGDLRLDQIDYAVIDDFRVLLSRTCNAKIKVREQLLKGKTINNILDILGNVLDLARLRGHIAFVPEITRAKATDPEFDFLTFEELDRLIASAEGVWRTMIIVAARTGLRRGELLGLRQDKDVDYRNHQLHVREAFVRGRFKLPKSDKSRVCAPQCPSEASARGASSYARRAGVLR